MNKLNLNIPGWNGREILEVIGNHSNNVPQNGNILELGALFGRTTATIGHCKPDNANLFTIDIWPDVSKETLNGIINHDKNTGEVEKEFLSRLMDKSNNVLSGNDFHLAWKVFTNGISNLSGIRGLTNMATENFPSFDLIIHDAAHDYEHVYEDLTNWFPKLKSGCVMIIDDYEPQFPGLVKAVDQYVLEHKLRIEMVTHRNILLRK